MKLGFFNHKKRILLFFWVILFHLQTNTALGNAVTETHELYLIEAIQKISERFNVYFTYDRALLKDVKVEYRQSDDASIQEAIFQVLEQTDLSFKIFDNRYVIIYKDDIEGMKSLQNMMKHFEDIIEAKTNTEERKTERVDLLSPRISNSPALKAAKHLAFAISGRVTDTNGDPLIGATILVKGVSGIGTTTNFNGEFSMDVPSEESVLIVSYIGFETREVSVDGRSDIGIELISSSSELDEVVVVGYGIQKKANLTGAVSNVDVAEAIGSRPITDLGRALQGNVPGLTITTASGDLGRNPNIRLRGMTGSLNGGGAKPLILLDNVEIRDLQMVNPEDIESISVLKDAASTSIYGTRAAWGVILITTKSGKKNSAPKISYSNNISLSTPTTLPEIAPAAEGAEMALAAVRRRIPGLPEFGIIGMYYDDEAIQKMRDWEDQYGGQNLGSEMVQGRDFEIRNGHLFFYRPWDAGNLYMKDWAPQQSHNISIDGGGEKTSYHLGLGYLGQDGVLKVNPDNFNRYNITLGLNTSVTDWFEARGKMFLSNSLLTEPYNYSSATYGPWYYLYRWPRTFPYGTYEGQPWRNTIAEVEQGNLNETKNTLSRIQAGGTIDITEGLKLDFNYTYSNTNTHFRAVGGPTSGINFWGGNLDVTDNFQSAVHDRVIYESYWREINNGRLFATLDKTFGDHGLKVIAGGDIEYYQEWEQRSERRGLLDPDKGEIPLATGDQYVGGERYHWATMGGFGRINYSYKNKFLLELNGRFDGSSRFPIDQQWGFFPSMSVGYVLTEESLLANLYPTLSFLKLRASFGSVGNQDVGINSNPFRFLSLVTSTNSNWWIGDQNKLTVGTPGALSSTLTWETVSTLDIGLDARFFDDQLGVTFDWYKRTTGDMITAGVTLPSSFGTSSPVRNYGEMQTTGWELALDWRKSFENGLNINLTGMFSDFTEEITRFANSTKGIGSNYEGRLIGEIWGYETDRFFTEGDFNGKGDDGRWIPNEGVPDQSLLEGNYAWFNFGPGDVKYRDLNNDGVVDYGSNTVDDPGDQRIIGNSTPRYQYGFRIGLDWKGFDFSTFLQGVGKRDFWASGPIFVPGYRYGEAWYSHQLDYWSPENPNAFYPRPNDQQQQNDEMNFQKQTKYLLDMSYLRMKNITLGYSLPEKIIEKAGMSQLRIYLSGENVFEFDNLDLPLDPEIDYTDVQTDQTSFGRVYPYRRTLSGGLQVTF